MPNHNPHATCELSEIKLRLRDDLRFSLQEYGGQPCYVIEDITNSRFYQIGIPEYTFISLLDGSTSLREALRLSASQLGADALGEAQAVNIVKWLMDTQLATSPDVAHRLQQSDTDKRRQNLWLLNPLMLKVPLFNPEKLLDALGVWFGWAFRRPALIGWLLLCFVAFRQLLCHAGQLKASANLAVGQHNWGWLLLTWGILKVFHELGHALTCRRFGGRVREFGLMWILLAPIPYVDVTSSWRFASKWQRIATAAAGMLVEFVLAASAVVIWSTTENPLVRHHAFNVMLLGSVTTIAFNANFLMRFDGYYIVADLVEIPNLYSQGKECLNRLLRHYVLGIKQAPPRWSVGHSVIITTYAIVSLMWRVFVCAVLVVAAERLLFGFGLVLSILALLAWVGRPMWKLARFVVKGEGGQRPNPRHLVGVVTFGICVTWALFAVVPWPLRITAPGIVQYANKSIIRAGTAGIVREIRVAPGENVELGQILCRLENNELAAELKDLELSLEQSRLRSRAFHRRGEMTAYQVEASTQVALNKRLAEVRERLANLCVQAPRAGKVIGRNLDSLLGRRLPLGSTLMEIVAEDEKELILSIDQDNVESYRTHLGQQVTVSVCPDRVLSCNLERVDPLASDEILYPALSAVAGGPLAIRPAVAEGDANSSWNYLQPRFGATVRLTNDRSVQLQAGQKALVRLSLSRDSLGRRSVELLQQWLQRRRIQNTTIRSTLPL